jgi:hypothetical protein
LQPEDLLGFAKECGKDDEVHVPLSTAIERARDLADKRDLILVNVSLFSICSISYGGAWMSFFCERTRQMLRAGSFPMIQAGGHLRERLPDPVNRAFSLW